jgi:hypothetical protein
MIHTNISAMKTSTNIIANVVKIVPFSFEFNHAMMILSARNFGVNGTFEIERSVRIISHGIKALIRMLKGMSPGIIIDSIPLVHVRAFIKIICSIIDFSGSLS